MAEDRPKKIETEQHQTATDAEIFEKAKINAKKLDKITLANIVKAILHFGELLADIKLRPYEMEFAERVVWSVLLNDGSTLTGEFARQSGKSTTIAVVLPALAVLVPLLAEAAENEGFLNTPLMRFKKGVWIGVYGPDYDRAGIIGRKINDTLSSGEAKSILSDPVIGMLFPEKLSSYIDRLPRGSNINVKSANKRVSIEGDTYHLVVTDETQEIDDYVLKKSVSPMLASTNGTTVHLGSAYPKRVYFYDIIKLNKQNDVNATKRKRCHFEADYREVQRYSKEYKKYIEKEKRKLGEQSDEFRMSYELYWPLESGMFITEDFLIKMCGAPYYVTNYDKTNDHVIGIDVAKKNDSTVVTILEVDWDNPIMIDPDSRTFRHNKTIKNWLELSGDDYDSQYYQICDFVDNYRWSRLIVDATGVGEPIYDRLYNRYTKDSKVVKPFVFSRPDKSYGYTVLYKELLAPRIQFPNNANAKALKKQQKFVQQLSNLSKEIEGGYLVVQHLSDSGHDDYGDSLMMAVMAAESEISEEIEVVMENIYKVGSKKIFGETNFWKNMRQ